MTRPIVQPALREWRGHMTQPATLWCMAGAAAILALAGAFDTDAYLRLIPRGVYWAAIVALSYGGGALASAVLARALPARLPRPWRLAAMALASGTGASVFVLAVNYATFGILPDADDIWPFLATVYAVSLIVTVTAATLSQPSPSETTPALLDRLPPAKRAPLVALVVEDHYVRVMTDAGQEMILMRLSDAIREAAPEPGLHIHRSHWVALRAVSGAARRGDGARVTLRQGAGQLELPASRSRLGLLRDAGLL